MIIIMTWRKRSESTHNSIKCASNSIVYTSKHYINTEFGEPLVRILLQSVEWNVTTGVGVFIYNISCM